jgi:hypothetical protein
MDLKNNPKGAPFTQEAHDHFDNTTCVLAISPILLNDVLLIFDEDFSLPLQKIYFFPFLKYIPPSITLFKQSLSDLKAGQN